MTDSSRKPSSPDPLLDRRELLRRSVLVGSALLLSGSVTRASPGPQAPEDRDTQALHVRGVTYDTGTNYDSSYALASRVVWQVEHLERDMRAIREGLHCNAVSIYGTDLSRLRQTAEIALEHGLEVWLQPRLMDANPKDRLEHLAEAAREAEVLQELGKVTLNIGVETSIFMSSIIPGDTYWERMETLGKRWQDKLPDYTRKLNAHLGAAAQIARESFSGPLTYSAGEWERIDWEPFDILSLTLYRNAENEPQYPDTLRREKALAEGAGKPVVIAEFGCCTFEGAAAMGGMGWDIIEYSNQGIPEIPAQYRRSEREQADTLAELLELYETERIDGAFIYDFSSPGSPYSQHPKYDLDRASYAIVKSIAGENEGEATRWEPKEAFGRVAEIYGRLERR